MASSFLDASEFPYTTKGSGSLSLDKAVPDNWHEIMGTIQRNGFARYARREACKRGNAVNDHWKLEESRQESRRCNLASRNKLITSIECSETRRQATGGERPLLDYETSIFMSLW